MIHWYHRKELVYFLAGVVILLAINHIYQWPVFFLGTVLLLGYILWARFQFYQRATRNLKTVALALNGTFEKGSFVFSTLPHIHFEFQGWKCRVTSMINERFRQQIVYQIQFDKEINFRINHRQHAGKMGTILLGENKEILQKLDRDPGMKTLLEELLSDFDHLYYGNDGILFVEASLDSSYTENDVIIQTFTKMVALGEFLELGKK